MYLYALIMEALSLNLQEQIFAYLLSRQGPGHLVSLPVSTLLERTNIDNVELTSRLLRTTTLQSLVRILEDVPTECSEESFDEDLATLVELPHVCGKLICRSLCFT
jgi:hypothetical protein